MPERVELEYAEASKTQRRYCCAGCYGHLVIYAVQESRLFRVACPSCGDGRGFVTKAYAEGRRQNSHAEAIEVKQMLREINIIQKSGRTAQDVLKELGF